MMMRTSPGIQTPMVGNLRREAFPIARIRVYFPQQFHCYQTDSGRELSTLEIRDTHPPYLGSLLKEHGDNVVDVVENFPKPPGKEVPILASAVSLPPNYKKLKAIARVSEVDSDGKLPPHILYLLELGMDLDQIKSMTRKFPSFAYYSLEGKIKPMVEFLLNLGANRSDIFTILSKRPQLCGMSLSENLIPTMTYLEHLGVDKEKWAKVIYRFPALLTYSKHKLKSTVDYLHELGLTEEIIGKILTRYPPIVGCSVEHNLRPTIEYFRSMGVDVTILVHRAPQVLCLSVEQNLKPITEFFLEKGYSMEEVAAMVLRSGVLYTYSLVNNIIPKWEFFLTMNYSMSDLVKFPQYFGYSLEKRIKPRYAQVRESGLKLSLNQVLIVAEPSFEKFLKRRMKKKPDDLGSNMEELNAKISDIQI